jgi:hypothetical protein
MTRSSASSTRRGRATALGSRENRSSARSRTTTAWAIATFGGFRNYSERVPELDGEYVGVRARIAAFRGPFLTASARDRLSERSGPRERRPGSGAAAVSVHEDQRTTRRARSRGCFPPEPAVRRAHATWLLEPAEGPRAGRSRSDFSSSQNARPGCAGSIWSSGWSDAASATKSPAPRRPRSWRSRLAASSECLTVDVATSRALSTATHSLRSGCSSESLERRLRRNCWPSVSPTNAEGDGVPDAAADQAGKQIDLA